MSMQTLNTVPKSFVQGDTVSMLLTFACYSAEDYTLKFCMTKGGAAITPKEATAEGASFALTISAEDSAKILPGIYNYALIVIDEDGQRSTIQSGSISVAPDPNGSIAKSDNQIILEKLKAAMTKLASGTNSSVNINGQQFTKRNLKELQDIIDNYQVNVDRELRELGLATKGGQKTIRTRFYP